MRTGDGRTGTLLRLRPRLALVLLAFLGACGGEAAGGGAEAEPDSLLAEALVPLHLADARAAVTGEDADSLRAAAYDEARRATGLDSAAIAGRLAAVARRPDEAAALYRRVLDRLEALRERSSAGGQHGGGLPAPAPPSAGR